MAQGSTTLHEDREALSTETVNRHRAIVSIMEELEAVDWYDQRVAATDDEELGKVLAHNRDEEKEHAAMVIEWLRRNDPEFDRQLRTYLFTEGSITETEEEEMGEGADSGRPTRTGDGSLGIGSLKGKD